MFFDARICGPLVVLVCVAACATAAEDGRLDLRVPHKPLQEQMRTPRLELAAVKDDKDDRQLQVAAKNNVRVEPTKKAASVRLQQQKRKKRVAAAQQ